MNKIFKNCMMATLVLLLGLMASCSTERTTADRPAKGHTVTFTVGTGITRAVANAAGFDREKTISTLYAVVFKQNGTYYDTYTISNYETTGNTCSFEVAEAGVYYLYIVANPTITDFATKDYTAESDFLADVESNDPGANMAASTNFLMTSKRTLADVDGDADTSLGTVEMTRAAARIDIDASAVTGLEIKKVVVKNRYTSTKLARLDTDADVTTVTKETSKDYVRGTSAGQVDAISDGTALVDNVQWHGIIYGYENPENSTDLDKITVVEITHELDGVTSTTSVPFESLPLKRNNLYTIVLTRSAVTSPLQSLTANIIVKDWNTATTLAYTSLSDTQAPSFTVTSSHSTDAATNPTKVRAKRTENNTITLEVTSGGQMASDLTYISGTVNGSAYTYANFTADGGTFSQTDVDYNADGTMVQTYSITIPQTMAATMVSTDKLTFRVSNLFDDTNYQEFDILSGIDIKMNPLWYVALYNMLNETDGSGNYKMATTDNAGYFFQWDHATNGAMPKFAAQSTSYSDYMIANKTISGQDGTWHLPVQAELWSIVPGGNTNIWGFDTGSGTYKATNQTVIFGYNDETKAGISEASYWKKISATELRAIRFIGTPYCSAWKYELVGTFSNGSNSYLRVSATLIDQKDTEADAASFLNDSWNSVTFGEDESAGAVQRTFFARGYCSNASGPTASYQAGEFGYCWSATENGSSNAWRLIFLSGEAHVDNVSKQNYGFSVRLFRDN